MERTLLSVEPAGDGWKVSLKNLLLDKKSTKFAAIEAASLHALERHAATGMPTGVRVHMNCGESVLVAMHG